VIRHVARGQALQADLGAHGRLTAQVEVVMPGRLAIVAVAPLPGDPAALHGVPARLTVATPRGLVRVAATVVAAERSGLLEVALTGEGEVHQRREHVRIAARVPGAVSPRDGSRPPLHTFTLDLSGGGVLVAGAGPAADVGTPVAVTVKLPEHEPLRAAGRVARLTGGGHVGLVFEGLDEEERDALVRWIFERQRRERAAGREERR
jgi:hypothetical protein